MIRSWKTALTAALSLAAASFTTNAGAETGTSETDVPSTCIADVEGEGRALIFDVTAESISDGITSNPFSLPSIDVLVDGVLLAVPPREYGVHREVA